MKLSLNKKALKNLSKDAEIIPADQTPEIGGGFRTTYLTADYTCGICMPTDQTCTNQSQLTDCPTTTHTEECTQDMGCMSA